MTKLTKIEKKTKTDEIGMYMSLYDNNSKASYSSIKYDSDCSITISRILL